MRYITDLTDVEWKAIKHLFAKAGNKSKWDKRELLNATLYILKNKIPWRNMPKNLPPFSTVYTFYRRLKLDGRWDIIVKELENQSENRENSPEMLEERAKQEQHFKDMYEFLESLKRRLN